MESNVIRLPAADASNLLARAQPSAPRVKVCAIGAAIAPACPAAAKAASVARCVSVSRPAGCPGASSEQAPGCKWPMTTAAASEQSEGLAGVGWEASAVYLAHATDRGQLRVERAQAMPWLTAHAAPQKQFDARVFIVGAA